MRRLLQFLLFLVLLHACSSIYFGEDSNSSAVVSIPDDYTPKASKSNKVRQNLVRKGEELVGSKYKYGGTTPKGFDCSGFTGYVYNTIGLNITRSSSSQSKLGEKIELAKALPGDLVFFKDVKNRKIDHVAMVISNNNKGVVVVHSTTSSGVRKDNITHSKYWKPKILFARRIID